MNIKSNAHSGHRERLRATIQEKGLDALPPERVLEYFLFFGIPYKDTLPIAKELLARFGSFEKVLSASPEELKKTKGMTNNAAMLLSTLPESYGLKFDKEKPTGTSLGPNNLLPYLKELFSTQNNVECIYVISMDSKQKLISADKLTTGTENGVSVSYREVAKTALMRKASKIIIAHNHPSANVTPSSQDLRSTAILNNLLESLDVQLVDHVIVGMDKVYSFFLRSEVDTSLKSGYLYEFNRLENYIKNKKEV